MKITLWHPHCEDRQTDRQTDRFNPSYKFISS